MGKRGKVQKVANTVETDEPRGLRAWLLELRRTGWIYPLAATLLLIVTTNFRASTPAEIAEEFASFILVACSIGLFVTLAYSLAVDRAIERIGHPLGKGIVHLVTLTICVGLGSELAIAVLRLAYAGEFDVARARAVMWRVGLGVGTGMMVASILYERLRVRAREVELRAERGRRELVQAQLAALQARTNPHFLFNSLNTVASLIEEDPEAAVDAVERLSDLLRYSLEGSKSARVSLGRELEAVRDYLALEGLRFGERLRYTIEVDERLLDEPVPPFVLQPVVENAVKHGVASRRVGGSIRVIGRRRSGEGAPRLELIVEDDGPGQSAAPESQSTKTGQADLVARLALAYGDAAEHHAGPADGGGYRVELRLPLTEARA